MQFIAIDVETANPDMGSICQIGLAEFIDGEIVNEWVALVDPEDYFDEVNISIHGIGPQTIKGCPNILDLADRLRSALDGKVAVCHTHFDRIALGRAFGKYNLRPIATTWLDSARVVRRTWKDLAWRDYCLANVCRKIGYDFQHHDALEDAKAAGFVLLAALRESQKDIDYWLRRVNQPIDPKSSSSGLAIQRDGNPEGDFYGEILVFTGALELPRSEAADLAASIGYQVASGVTKRPHF
ncbi:DNA polymerase III epsilon subunit-like 3'-5' exonuclease [Leptothrix ochracea L12]|uniref:DNA polymerase III epsilon subunit-like 3'-5' exonuclease n=1 Tax=Leptothrix ochracea L12 TaxID=735332 RepID=I4Z5Q9_9BURK|nr:exonuclease domain-containing protein [Leptothrix ochracea]EIM31551.1 DNA polymerase III epsilon subunit-like 3'-5' exonuclease [Leptothrix ochracea L12]